MQTFSVYRFFWNSPDPETISEEAAREARSQIAAAVDQKRSIMGNTTVWVFPPFANAPTVPPPTPIPLEYSKRVPKQFVPPFDSPEYQRLSDVRNRMLATLVRSFPEVQYWVIGYEDSLEFFYEPDGAKLRTERLVRFAVDALEASYQVIKHENPSAIVVGHFLGSPTSPIKIADEIIQPADLFAMLSAEMASRGKPSSVFYDLWITFFDPTLLLARDEEQPVRFDPNGSTSASQAAVADGGTWRGRAGSSLQSTPLGNRGSLRNSARAPLRPAWRPTLKRGILGEFPDQTDPIPTGWNVYWQEELETDGDLVDDYADWEDWQTNETETQLTDTDVTSGLARLKTVDVTGSLLNSIGGGRTPDDLDIVPHQYFNATTSYRNYWTAVQDFYPTSTPPYGAHTPVCIRVNDRTYDGQPNQTRLCGWTYAGSHADCNNQPCGALQLTGDYGSQSTYRHALYFFALTKNGNPFSPFSHQSTRFRAQIHERQALSGWPPQWVTEWRAEVWDLDETDPNLALIGYSSWVTEYMLNNNWGISTPELSVGELGQPGWHSSRYAIGIGPGDGNGYIDTYFTGVAFWQY